MIMSVHVHSAEKEEIGEGRMMVQVADMCIHMSHYMCVYGLDQI